ncbi:retrovirus-related Pol polyprotein from transposon 297 [Trichonephila clavipes]|nr:retrovirus-related Pol polyprotein from transposon 297 [Trichonephila clavipes]
MCSGISAAKGYARKFNQCSKNSEEIKPLYEQAASQVQVTNQVYSLEKELLVKNREDKLGNVVKLIVVPEGLRDPIKSLCHEGTSAHLGITKSKDKLNRYFYWPNCYRDMEQFVKTCDQCQKAGKPNDKKKTPLKLVPVIQEVFTKLNIDACGPLPITSKGNRYIITAICMSSKFPEAIPVSDISSCSDYRVFERFGILVRHSSVYHPQSIPVERFHRTLKRLLRVLCLDAGSEWDKHLPSILLALRTVSHESTGYTPSELVYGKNLRTPETLVMEHWMEPEEEGNLVTEYMFKLINRLKRCQEVAINKMEEMQVKRKTWYDKNAVKREFKDGDLVLVLATSRANKLAVQWIGPGTILNKISETNYLVEIPGRRETSQIYHINMLKPYYKRPEHVNASELNKHLHDKQMDRLRELLNKYSKCFSNNPGLTNLVEHEIQLVSDQPVRTKPYRMSHRQNEILKNEINRMLKLGIIEVGESDYMSPIILVEVAGKEPRPCIDYRKLNGIIRTEYFPLPNIEERVEKVSAAKFITVFDLSKGYWQIPLSKTAQRYAAFCTSFGTYRPLRMSFGLKNAAYFFSKLMAELLNGLEDFVVPYLDDIAIFSDTWESHIKHMETVLQRIKRAKLTIKPSKCKFAQQNVKFLGHIVGQGFRTPSEIKVQAVLEFPTPRTKTQIRAFLGIAGYYQKYINLFSVIAAPLTDALKGRAKKGEIKWTTECENAFRELKGKLIDKPILYAPNFEREFIVQTDASNAGIGAVLTQLTEQGEEHPILYLSKKFSEVEKRYCTTEKECASIVFAIKRLHYYLDGNSFLVMTDHNPLVWLNRNVSSNPRLMRWALALQPYNFRIVHRSANKKTGKKEGFLNPISKESIPLSTYHVDFIGPLPSTNKSYQHIFTVVDAFTKFTWLYPVKTVSAESALEKLKQQQKTFGNPIRIISDRGSAFTSKLFNDYCDEENIQHLQIATGVPRGNGQVERIHRTLIPVLTKLSLDDSTKWYKYVDRLQRILNSTISRSTKWTPFELLVGIKMRNKEDILMKDLLLEEMAKELLEQREFLRNDAKKNIETLQSEKRKTCNRRRKKASLYKEGDLVAIQRTQFGAGLKLRPKFLGPYKVTKVNSKDRYEVEKVGQHNGPNSTTTSADLMKHFYA